LFAAQSSALRIIEGAFRRASAEPNERGAESCGVAATSHPRAVHTRAQATPSFAKEGREVAALSMRAEERSK